MNKDVLKEIRKAANLLPDKNGVNHHRRLKKALQRGGTSALQDYIKKEMFVVK